MLQKLHRQHHKPIFLFLETIRSTNESFGQGGREQNSLDRCAFEQTLECFDPCLDTALVARTHSCKEHNQKHYPSDPEHTSQWRKRLNEGRVYDDCCTPDRLEDAHNNAFTCQRESAENHPNNARYLIGGNEENEEGIQNFESGYFVGKKEGRKGLSLFLHSLGGFGVAKGLSQRFLKRREGRRERRRPGQMYGQELQLP